MFRSTRCCVLLLPLALAFPAWGEDPKTVESKTPTDIHGDALPTGARQRLGTVRFRHTSTALAYSPDGALLASGGHDNVIRLFDAKTGREVHRLIGHRPRTYAPAPDLRNPSPVDLLVEAVGEGGVNSVAFSPDGKTLASGGWDDTVRLWDVKTGKELRRIDAHKAMVGRVAFSPDGKILASRGALDGSVRLWDPVTGKELARFTGLNNINPWRFNHDTALAFSPDGKTLVATARNNLVFFDVASAAEVRRVPSHVYGITVAYSPDGKLFATGGVDEGKDVYSLRIWDAATAKELRKCTLPKNEPPTYLAWDPNNNGQFAAVIAEDDMHVFDSASGKEVTRIPYYWPSRAVYSPDGKVLAASGSGPKVRLWDPSNGKELAQEFDGHRGGVNAVAVGPEGKLIASAGADGVRLWDPTTGKTARNLTVKGGVTCMALSPDGKVLATGGHDRIVRLWEVSTGKQGDELKGHKNALCGLAFSRDGKLLASGDVQSTVNIWSVNDGVVVQSIDNKSGTEVIGFAFDPDGKTLYASGAWNDSSFLPKPGTVVTINGKEVKWDGELSIQGVVMTRKEGYFVLQWEVKTGKEMRRFGGLNDTIRSLALSADGKTLAAAASDGKVCLWDTATGKDRLHIVAHPENVAAAFSGSPSLAFSPDGKRLASASNDRTLRLWDVTTAAELGQFQTPDSAFGCVTFTPDGKKLVTGAADTSVLLWDVSAAPPPPRRGKSGSISIQ
jgi:WD40 repeat protein